MKISLSWLSQHLATDADVSEIAQRLTSIGLEVEAIEDKASELAPFTVSKIIEALPHPNADKLKVCRVQSKFGELSIVCGAPNAVDGAMVALARQGDRIPSSGEILRNSTIRGVESQGMLCSQRELKLSDEHEGILHLPSDAIVGEPIAKYLGIDDVVLDVAITPNRGDCLGVRGIARDLAASGIGTLRAATEPKIESSFANPVTVKLDYSSPDADCQLFSCRLIRGVTNGQSPEEIQQRLMSIGLRPINLAVDVTNLVCHDRGRPLHVFDYRKLRGNLRVGTGRTGESFAALDGKDYSVEGLCTIYDDSGPISLGGIMGGASTGCDENTVDILVESAWFTPSSALRSGRSTQAISDARHRFERYVDPESCLPGLDIGVELIMRHGGGTTSQAKLSGRSPYSRPTITYPYSEFNRLIGTDLDSTSQRTILDSLGFEHNQVGSGAIEVVVPSWRHDVMCKADLVEEMLRMHSTDRIKSIAPVQPIHARSSELDIRSRIKRNLACRGLNEMVSWSFISKQHSQMWGGGRPELSLINPMSSDMTDMRPSLLPGILSSLARNANHGQDDIGLFEVGQVFSGNRAADQHLHATGARYGRSFANSDGRQPDSDRESCDALDCKGDALAVIECAGFSGTPEVRSLKPTELSSWQNGARSGLIFLGNKILAQFGEIHPIALDEFEIKKSVAYFEVYLDRIPHSRKRKAYVHEDLQPVKKDLSFVVDKNLAAESLVKIAKKAGGPLVTSIRVFDVYVGDSIPEDKKSIAIEVIVQPHGKSLTDHDFERLLDAITVAAADKLGALLR